MNPNAVIDHDAIEKDLSAPDRESKVPDYNDTFTMRQLADLTGLSGIPETARA